jgi:hypothetical protein
MNLSYSFYKIWNDSLLVGHYSKKEPKARERLWATELGKSYIDLFLTLKGEPPSNNFSETTLRKFDAGIIWEKVIETILKKTGVMIENQGWVEYKINGCLPVVGKLDFLIGGKTDKEKAKAEIEKIKDLLPENVYKASFKIIESLPEELKTIVLEIKSISSFMFNKYMTSGQANDNHRLQILHYLLAKNLDEGHIVYISKDDARLLEVGVFNPSFVNQEYEKFVKEFSNYYFNNEQPPKEKEIVFDEEWGKFDVNWKVLYSQYLTKIYGYKDQEEVRKLFSPLVESWNRVLGRVKNKKEMTKDNLTKIKEMKDWGFNPDEIIEKLKVSQQDVDADVKSQL